MSKIHFLLATLAICIAPAHAVTLTATGTVDIEYRGGDDAPIIDPPYTGVASFNIVRNHILDFEFSMLGFTWTLEDLPSTLCLIDDECWSLPPTDDRPVGHLLFEFADEQGGGLLIWDWRHEEPNFGLVFGAGEFGFSGTSENLQAGSSDPFSTVQINLREPGTFLLLSMGLIGLALMLSFVLQRERVGACCG